MGNFILRRGSIEIADFKEGPLFEGSLYWGLSGISNVTLLFEFEVIRVTCEQMGEQICTI